MMLSIFPLTTQLDTNVPEQFHCEGSATYIYEILRV